MTHRSPELAALAREKNADAIIFKSRSSELAGGFGTAALMPGGEASGKPVAQQSTQGRLSI
jgi:hypothetical protein